MLVRRGTVFGELPFSRVVARRRGGTFRMESDLNRVERKGEGAQRPSQPLTSGLDESLLERPKAEEQDSLQSRGSRSQNQSFFGSKDGIGNTEIRHVVSRLHVQSHGPVRNCACDHVSRVADVEPESVSR